MHSVTRDEVFYFDMTIFQVEDYLFKVPRRPFEDQSDIFRSMFLLPQGQSKLVEGMSDENPLVLEGISKKDFRAFLQVLLPPTFGEDMDYSEEEWLSVLSLSNMWGFTRIRQTAIEKLQNNSIDLITKIELAHKYDIREWLFGAYLALGKRAEPLSVGEGARLGYDFALKMATVREQLLRDKIAHPNAYRQRPPAPFIPPRGESPRGSIRNGQNSASNGVRARLWATPTPQHPFPGELEDSDDIVLARAIQEVFGIRGEHPSITYRADLDTDDFQNMSMFFINDTL
ncbi:uncharacterized protein FOMMEDRAFT_143095 [Fomitiporia mediterranea MF3/22]|uniref:uncharacterized protein n=1 Tax=Fomitiporia mediterranea (strain MF3/22) TaxID=694068 RepID=UPI0004409362|nr:uncharacterized protein FOMMEDRAFT_143095 [Fomitiporia mediterranea MF3/22]EJC98678.1 hypothetical protein FOMMEDRAFT_143095 [Fomitiporia mediterranea MF3/22]